MKSFAFALLMLVACATAALPQVSVTDFGAERRDIDIIIANAIEKLKERIVERDLDPYELDRTEGEYVFILPSVFSATAFVENLRFSGLSNIVVNEISYSPWTSELTLDITMPNLMVVIGGSGFEITAVGREISGSLSGLLAVNGLGIGGKARVSLLSSKVSVSDIEVDARLHSIQSALNIRINGLNLSTPVNNWLTNLPGNLALYSDLINRGLARIIAILVEHFF